MITRVKLTEEEYKTLLYICDGETLFEYAEAFKEPLKSFIGDRDIGIRYTTDYVHFLK